VSDGINAGLVKVERFFLLWNSKLKIAVSNLSLFEKIENEKLRAG
jgi:hypothetical protein